MSREQRSSVGLVLFVVLSFLGSWFVSATLRVFELTVAPAALGTRLFTTSLLYALTMGWQPLVATWLVRRWIDPPDELDLGLRPAPGIFSVVGGVGALVLAIVATLVAMALDLFDVPLTASAEPAVGRAGSPLIVVAAFVATIALIWVQAVAEEVGWRGYFLPRAMERLGHWQGLLLHGAVWGLWYAPVLFFASYGQLALSGSVERSAGFVLTCLLLGTLLGWLRLASGSLAPVVLANTTLTLAAGLPYVVSGVDAGARSAAFGPAGWVVLVIAIGGLLLTRWRAVVQVPRRAASPTTAPFLLLHLVFEEARKKGPRYLN